MGSFSALHWIIVVLVVVLLFGGGRISGLMGDVAKGIKSFKKGMTEDDDVATSTDAPKKLEGKAPEPQSASSSSTTGTKVG